MRNSFFSTLLLLCTAISWSQEIIQLPYKPSSTVSWEGSEKSYYSDIWQTQVVTNVSVPTMEVFRPNAEEANGTAVIIAPGGGLYALSINSEGNDVAKWLNKKGITAFVLKYRLYPTGADGVKEITEAGASVITNVKPILPLAVEDGLKTIAEVRANAALYNIDPNKIGFMGFSAGGAVTMGVALQATKENRPNFIVPVYPWMTVVGDYEVPQDAPPMLVICASDDPLDLAAPSASLYAAWLQAGKPVGMHMYAKGGHGFGMRKQNLPSDKWIERFYEWSLAEGITVPRGGM
ncbi:alpha/beta hydrolase [Arenibacter sp. GZD96]|uniref:alpha/beta hydrolase n=1 Tax=Aurantibrevibacter litoralis TaxID=3106030 RepID=UPI002B002809|nr:alpha/beta hydrolase [Arenibacter sp. GZD-96]MEA1787424.1 alpha/beta hydrolase [Arenibacter sp. GZD-96]